MTHLEYSDERKHLISSIKSHVKSHLRPCGYVDRREADNRLRIAVPLRTIRISKNFCVKDIVFFMKDGVCIDAHCHGALTQKYSKIPIEDLFRINQRLKTQRWKE